MNESNLLPLRANKHLFSHTHTLLKIINIYIYIFYVLESVHLLVKHMHLKLAMNNRDRCITNKKCRVANNSRSGLIDEAFAAVITLVMTHTCFQRTDFLVFFSVHYLGWSHFNTTSLVERRPRIVCLHEPGRKTVQHLINTFSHHLHRSDTHAAQEVTHVSVGTVNLSRSQNNYGGFEEVSFSFCCKQRSKSRPCFFCL